MSLIPLEADNAGEQRELDPHVVDEQALFFIGSINASLKETPAFQKACAKFYFGVLDNTSIIYPPEERDIHFVHLGSAFSVEYTYGYLHHALTIKVLVLGGKILSHDEMTIRLRSRRFEEPPPEDLLKQEYGDDLDHEFEKFDRRPLIEVEATSREYEKYPKRLLYRNSKEAVELVKSVWGLLATNSSG